MTTEHLIDPADADRFQNRWRDVKAGFVDDPTVDTERLRVALRDYGVLLEHILAF